MSSFSAPIDPWPPGTRCLQPPLPAEPWRHVKLHRQTEDDPLYLCIQILTEVESRAVFDWMRAGMGMGPVGVDPSAKQVETS